MKIHPKTGATSHDRRGEPVGGERGAQGVNHTQINRMK